MMEKLFHSISSGQNLRPYLWKDLDKALTVQVHPKTSADLQIRQKLILKTLLFIERNSAEFLKVTSPIIKWLHIPNIFVTENIHIEHWLTNRKITLNV